jgi:hypothetical protein
VSNENSFAPLDAKGKVETIVARCIEDLARHEATQRAKIEEEAAQTTQPHFEIDADKFVSLAAWDIISWDKNRQRQAAL